MLQAGDHTGARAIKVIFRRIYEETTGQMDVRDGQCWCFQHSSGSWGSIKLKTIPASLECMVLLATVCLVGAVSYL